MKKWWHTTRRPKNVSFVKLSWQRLGWGGMGWNGWDGGVMWSGVGWVEEAIAGILVTEGTQLYRASRMHWYLLHVLRLLFHLDLGSRICFISVPAWRAKFHLTAKEVPFDSRGFDKRSNFQRNRHRGQGDQKFRRGADTRKRKRKSCLSDNCPHQGRRGLGHGLL